jgi:S1-C subfamily serine protease
MRSRLIAVSCALLLFLSGDAAAENFYRWQDSDGSVRITRDQPALGVPYETIALPDPIRWRSAPEILPPVPAGNDEHTQSLLRAASASVYGLVGKKSDPGGDGSVVYGSAVAITDKLAMTNCHIIQDAGENIYIGRGGDEPPERAKLVAANYVSDRCVVAVARMELSPVPGIRRFDTLEVGETVYAIGNPLRLERTLSSGLLSAKRVRGELRLLQTTAPISHGSSGGGLFDAHGNLLGITSYSLAAGQAINFAIPAEDYWR